MEKLWSRGTGYIACFITAEACPGQIFSTTPLPEDDSKGIVDHIIDIWGMPSEVFYTTGENPVYTLVYQTENCNIAIYGFYDWEHLTVPNTVQIVFVYGKNTIPYPQYFDKYEKME